MKKIIAAAAILVSLALASGCTSFYHVIKDTPATKPLSSYKQIYVGWLDLRPGDWQKYGFESEAIWAGQISQNNTLGIQAYMKENLGDRVLGGAQSKDEAPPTTGDLYIKLIFDRIDLNHNGWGALDEMFLDVEFVDIASKETVYKASVTTNEAGSFPRNWKGGSFDGRLDNELYNLATLMAEKLQ